MRCHSRKCLLGAFVAVFAMPGFAVAEDANPEIGAVDTFQWFCVWHTVEEIPQAIKQINVEPRVNIKEASPDEARRIMADDIGRAWIFNNFSPFMIITTTNRGLCSVIAIDVNPPVVHAQFKSKFKRRIHITSQFVDLGEENQYVITDTDPTGRIHHLMTSVITARPQDKPQGVRLQAMHEVDLNRNGIPSPSWP